MSDQGSTPPPPPPPGSGDGGYSAPPPPPPGSGDGGYGGGYSAPPPPMGDWEARWTTPKGMTVLILGILSLVCCSPLGIVALAMGNNALKEIDAQPGRYGNRQIVQIGRISASSASSSWRCPSSGCSSSAGSRPSPARTDPMATLVRVDGAPGPTRDRARRLALPGAVAAAAVLGTVTSPLSTANQPGHYPLCPTYALAGIYCPGCGMLRATHESADLDLVGAFALQPAGAAALRRVGTALRALGGRALARRAAALGPADLAAGGAGGRLRALHRGAQHPRGRAWLSPV